jgi:GT2 family glycosyltransferase
MHSNKETLSIVWCDNGTTDGKFTEGLVYSLIHAASVGVPVNNAIRVQGNQIARQRQAAIEMWQKVGTDWALWVDSDIVLTKEMLKTLWDTADKHVRPVVSGVYFISKNMEGSLMQPMPCIFNETGDEYAITYLHPLPKNQVVKVDNAGMGLVLMHKSVLQSLNVRTVPSSVKSRLRAYPYMPTLVSLPST